MRRGISTSTLLTGLPFPEDNMSPLETLSNEVLVMIATYLQPHHLSYLSRTSRRFASISAHALSKPASCPHDRLPALCWASRQGHEPLVKLLLDKPSIKPFPGKGSSPHPNQLGTPLIWAARRGHTRIVELLLDRGADIDEYGSVGNESEQCSGTPLIAAIKYSM